MPHLFKAAKRSAIMVRTVGQAAVGGWWQDVSPNMGAEAIQEFLTLVDRMQLVQVEVGIQDSITWIWGSNGLSRHALPIAHTLPDGLKLPVMMLCT